MINVMIITFEEKEIRKIQEKGVKKLYGELVGRGEKQWERRKLFSAELDDASPQFS